MPTSTGTVATKPRKNGIFDNVDVTKRSLLFKCLRVARSHRENTAIPSTEGLSEGHCHNPLQNNGLKNGYSRIMLFALRLKSQEGSTTSPKVKTSVKRSLRCFFVYPWTGTVTVGLTLLSSLISVGRK